MQFIDAILLLVSILGIVYLTVANAAVLAFARRKSVILSGAPEGRALEGPPGALPSITVLKPIYGLEPMLYENLASFCDQDYSDYEVLFCLHDANDPAVATVQRVIAAFPEGSPRLLVGENARHRNPKTANLAKGAHAARGEIIVISDSDVRVGRDYLHSIAASFADDRTGAVSSLYRGIAGDTWVPQLGAAYVEEQFAPSVLVATTFRRMRFCLGASMSVRRNALAAIGGIEALGPYLADDHKLGELVAARGCDVALCDYVVSTTIAETSLGDLWSHELRWARTNLVLAPIGYFFSFLMFGVPLALLYLLVARNWIVGLPLLAGAALLRIALHFTARKALNVRERAATLWLLPARDALSVAVWFASFFGRSVHWRQAHVTVSPDGEIE
jgi:ceramide glucosyltransferase